MRESGENMASGSSESISNENMASIVTAICSIETSSSIKGKHGVSK